MANLPLSTPINDNSKDEPGHASLDIPTRVSSAAFGGSIFPRILHRVPTQLREHKNYIYDPVVLSLGPYHHNLRSQQFLQVEKFKSEILRDKIGPSTKNLFYSEVLERVHEIRIFYGELSDHEYGDKALVEMMLRDACFLSYFMEAQVGHESFYYLSHHLGLSVMVFLHRDYLLLENQIPLWVLKLFMTLKFCKEDEGEALICRFLSLIRFGDQRTMRRAPWEGKEQEPLHLLEAAHRILIVKEGISSNVEHRGSLCGLIRSSNILHRGSLCGLIRSSNVEHRGSLCGFIRWRRQRSIQHNTDFEVANSPFRSVTYLKSKGIYCEPSSYCLTDIAFNSYAFYGKLLLPIWFVSNNTKVFFSNIIAFEMSPKIDAYCYVLSYINFMKSLLESPKDVKELREKGILFSNLRNDEEVLKVFEDIDTYGVDMEIFFCNVNMRINKHCKSKAKTWMAELIHTQFRSPWTAIALFAAGFLLCLTFLQTYYTMNPK